MHCFSVVVNYDDTLPYTSDVVTTLARSVKTCVLRLSSDKMCFILSDRIPVGGANLWCEVLQENLFDEYRLEGKDERNEIYLEVVMEQLSRALKSSLGAIVVKLKLTKKQGACLTVEITQVGKITWVLKWLREDRIQHGYYIAHKLLFCCHKVQIDPMAK